jgi:allantoinase
MSAFTRPEAGMDQPHYAWSPVPGRPSFQWPSSKPVAVAVVILVEHVEFSPPEGSLQTLIPGGVGPFPFPNLPLLAHREYGHRVGVFRVLDALRRHGAVPSVAIDAMSAERYPYIVERCREQGAEFVAHGISVSRVISQAMVEDTERAYIAESLDRLESAVEQRSAGWLGPEQSESTRTPELLRSLGIRYVCDWPNDDQPYEMDGHPGLISVPTTYGLDDAAVLWSKATPLEAYERSVIEYFSGLAQEGEESGRTLVLVVRPWLTGQPFRIGSFEKIIDTIAASGQAWLTTTGEIASAYPASSFASSHSGD